MIGTNGVVYVAAGSALYALTGSSGLADAPWPEFRHDGGHTASLYPSAIVPSVPQGVTATQGDYGVTLGWLSAHGAAYYEIWRNNIDESTSATRIVERVGANTSFFDRAPESGMTNYYWVKAVSPAGPSPFGESVRGISRPIGPGDKKWELDLGVQIFCDPVVGTNGTIYLSAGDLLNGLYIVGPDGA